MKWRYALTLGEFDVLFDKAEGILFCEPLNIVSIMWGDSNGNEAAIAEAQSRIDGLEKDSEDNSITFLKNTVQEEDTLLSICERLGLNYEEIAKMILGINGLSGESEIVAGQTMLIPVS